MTEREKRTTQERAGAPPPDRGVRLEWAEMPGRVRAAIERWLGGTVVDAVTQPTGFSPGVAARLLVDDGRRVFVKAVGPERNPDTPGMHRREARIMAAMPCAAPVPRLLWTYDEGDGGWVALVFEDVNGRHPTRPWRTDELDRVVAAMEDLSRLLTPSPMAAATAGTASAMFAKYVRGWRPLQEERPSRLGCLDEWSRRNLHKFSSHRGHGRWVVGGRHAAESGCQGRQHPDHAGTYVVRRLASRACRARVARRGGVCAKREDAGRAAA